MSSSASDAMDVTTSEQSKVETPTPIANATQTQIAQKTWEISNFIQGYNLYLNCLRCNTRFFCSLVAVYSFLGRII